MRRSRILIVVVVLIGMICITSIPPDQNMKSSNEIYLSQNRIVVQKYTADEEYIVLLTEDFSERTKSLIIFDMEKRSELSINLGNSNLFDLDIVDNQILLSYLDYYNLQFQLIQISFTGEIRSEVKQQLPFNTTILSHDVSSMDNNWVLYLSIQNTTTHNPDLYRISQYNYTEIDTNFEMSHVFKTEFQYNLIIGMSDGKLSSVLDSTNYFHFYNVEMREIPYLTNDINYDIMGSLGDYSLILYNRTHQSVYDLKISTIFIDLIPDVESRQYNEYLFANDITLANLSKFDELKLKLKIHTSNQMFSYVGQHFTIQPQYESMFGKYIPISLINTETDRLTLFYIVTGDRIAIKVTRYQLQHALSEIYPTFVPYLLHKTSIFVNIMINLSLIIVIAGLILQLFVYQAYPETSKLFYTRIWIYYLKNTRVVQIIRQISKKYQKRLKSHRPTRVKMEEMV